MATGIKREHGKDMVSRCRKTILDDLANDLKWIMGDGNNGEDLDTYAHVGNTIRDVNDQNGIRIWIPMTKVSENNKEFYFHSKP